MLDTIKTFVQVVEAKSFSKAAERMKISPPVITRRIMQLETELNVRLLQRNTRQVTVTEAGLSFYETCIHILETYQVSLNRINHSAKTLSGTLKIGLPASINYLYVAPQLTSFLEKYPELKIHIIQGNHLLDLLSDGFDLVVHCGLLPNSNFYSKSLGKWSKITCASPTYIKKNGMPKHPDELSHFNCLDHMDNKTHVWHYKNNQQSLNIAIAGNSYFDNSLSLKAAAINHGGLVYLPSFTVKNEIKNKKLIPVLTSFEPEKLDMHVVYPSKYMMSEKVKKFIDFLISLDMVN